MATDCIAQVTFECQGVSQPIVARFDQAHASSDGGAVLLKALDDRLGLTRQLAASLTDRRQPGKVQHALLELVEQRVFGIACGYADCNDSARLAEDPVYKLLLDRDPLTGPALASQPTLSRFENGVGGHELYLASVALADLVIAHHRARLQGRARRITIDLDPTDDPTHGQQELSFFNGHYDTWCYLPLVATLTFNAEPRQYLVAAVLRPGNSPAKRGAIGLLTRLCRRLRAAFPGVLLRVRLDGGFASPEVLDCLDAEGVERRGDGQQCAFGQTQPPLDGAGSDALQGQWRDRGPLWRDPLRRPEVAPQTADHHEGRGCAASRPGSQEQSSVRDHQPGRCPRGGLSGLSGAGRHGEPAQGAASRAGAGPDELPSVPRQPVPRAADRRGVHPVQTLQAHAQGTACADAQVSTLRERLLKLAAWVERSVRRIVLHLPTSFPWRLTWRQIAVAVGAAPA